MTTTAVENVSETHKTLITRMRGAAILCLLFVSMLAAARSSHAATFTVTSNADSGAGTLRQAILDANASSGPDEIVFSLAAFSTIAPTSQLPTITDALTIGSGTVYYLDGINAGDSVGLRISAANCVVQGQIITRFQQAGIRIDGSGNNTILRGNFIGTNNLSASGLGNFNRGILIVGTTGNLIGGASAADRNVISGNSGTGISITAGGSATITGNYIGTNIAGTADLGNTQEGVRIVDSSNSTVGGSSAATRNVIAGNDGSGVSIIQSSNTTTASGNTVSGNYIGVNANGNTALPNTGSGVLINASFNNVGQSVATGNVISANSANGVSISSNFSIGNNVAGNLIGVGADGTTALGNRDNGVQLASLARDNFIGAAGATVGACSGSCNVIANNGDAANATSARAGIYIDSSAGTGNAIRANSIYNNTGLGIDLGAPGATANDALDPDTGANNLQNKPVLTTATSGGALTGTLNSTASTAFTIDFFRNLVTDTQPGSEGRTYVGSVNVTTDANGNGSFSFATTAPLAVGQFITATATRAAAPLDTSEFSDAVAVTNGAGGAAGIECDVFDRPNGDGTVDSLDVGQVTRFQLALDTYQSNEFQRADCFDQSTRGDGVVDSLDVAQAQRYQLGLDSLQPAGGPTARSAATKTDKEDAAKIQAPAAPREVRVVTQNAAAGQTITVVLETDAAGDESIYGFSLNYSTAVLTYVPNSATIGSGATRQAGGLCALSSNTGTAGQFGFSINCNNSTITAGNNRPLVTLQFTVAGNAPTGTTALTFGDTPTNRSVSSNPAAGPIQSLTTTFTNGAVNVGSNRAVRVVSQNANRGATITVVLQADTAGDESIYGFSLNYSTSVLTYVPNSATIGSGATNQAGGTCSLATNTGTAGQFGFSINCNNSTITAGTNRPLVTLQFTVANNAPAGNTFLEFGSTPTNQRVASNPTAGPIQALPTAFVDGAVTVAGPTAAPAAIGGRLVSASGAGLAGATVKLFDTASGATHTVVTDANGVYRFENLPVGGDYVVTPSALGYSFNPQRKYFSLVQDLTDVDFVGTRSRKRRF